MTQKIYVTGAQVEAARLIVERSAKRGIPVPSAVRKIAEAMPESAGSSETETVPQPTNA
jgi:Flp pilus assembly protein TadB